MMALKCQMIEILIADPHFGCLVSCRSHTVILLSFSDILQMVLDIFAITKEPVRTTSAEDCLKR